MKHYGCFNKKRKDYLIVQDGWTADGKKSMVMIDNVMSSKCRYDNRAQDARCENCKQPWDTEYLKKMGLL